MANVVSKEREFRISRESFLDVVTVSINLGCEDMAVAAYGDSRIPSILVTRETFQSDPSINQKIEFRSIDFKGFEGYRIWCCEIDGEELKACLVR